MVVVAHSSCGLPNSTRQASALHHAFHAVPAGHAAGAETDNLSTGGAYVDNMDMEYPEYLDADPFLDDTPHDPLRGSVGPSPGQVRWRHACKSSIIVVVAVVTLQAPLQTLK